MTTKDIFLDTINKFNDILQKPVPQILNETIVKRGSKWCVISKKKNKEGKHKNLGKYDTKEEAEKRLKQVEYFKHVKEGVEQPAPNRNTVIKLLQKLPQPIMLNGGGYGYTCNVKKDPMMWETSDGDTIDLKKYGSDIKEIGQWLSTYQRQDWENLFDDRAADWEIEDYINQLIEERVLVPGKSMKSQEEFEQGGLRGDY